MKALQSESEEQRKQFGTKKCRIVTHAGKGTRNVVVEILPSEPPRDRSVDVKKYDWGSKKMGESYLLKAPVNFLTGENTMEEHKIFGEGKTTGWSMAVVKNMIGYKAPIIGVISNSFDDISPLVDLEDGNVALEPIFNDVLGARARSTVSTIKTAVDEFLAELNQFFFSPKYPPQIPAIDLFGLEECKQEANSLANQSELPLSLKDAVNACRKSLSLGALLALAKAGFLARRCCGSWRTRMSVWWEPLWPTWQSMLCFEK